MSSPEMKHFASAEEAALALAAGADAAGAPPNEKQGFHIPVAEYLNADPSKSDDPTIRDLFARADVRLYIEQAGKQAAAGLREEMRGVEKQKRSEAWERAKEEQALKDAIQDIARKEARRILDVHTQSESV